MTWVVVSGARVDLGQIVMARFFFCPSFAGASVFFV